MGNITAQWSGFDDFITSVQYVNSLGTSPGLITINLTTPQEEFEPDSIADVTLSDGFNEILIRECLVIGIQEQRSTQGFTKTVMLEDRRWKWRFNFINGHYNRFLPDGTVDIDSEKDLTALVALLLIAMKETGLTEGLGKLEKLSRPTVNWDYSRPAEELEKLLEAYGKQVSYGLDNLVSIVKLGEIGEAKETIDAQELPSSKNIIVKPTTLLFIGKRDLVQGDWLLEAVAIDSDGATKPLADLSYFKELGGSDLHYLLGITDPENRERARKSLFRYYRITNDLQWDDFRNPEDPLGEVPQVLIDQGINKWELKNLLPLPGRMAEFGKENSVAKKVESEIHGEFYDVENNRTLPRSGPLMTEWPQVPFSYTLELDTGLVKFDRPIFKLNLGVFETALLYLRTALETIRVAIESEDPIGGPGDTTEIITDQSLGLRFVDGSLPKDNSPTLEKIVELLTAREAQYDDEISQGTVKLVGLHQIKLDGVARQVTYSIGSGGANTTYSLNNEHERRIPTMEQKKNWSKIRNIIKSPLLKRGENE